MVRITNFTVFSHTFYSVRIICVSVLIFLTANTGSLYPPRPCSFIHYINVCSCIVRSFCRVDEVCFVTAVIPPKQLYFTKTCNLNASYRKIAKQLSHIPSILYITQTSPSAQCIHTMHAARLQPFSKALVNSNLIKLAFSKSDEYNCVHKYCRFMFMHVRNPKIPLSLCHIRIHIFFVFLFFCVSCIFGANNMDSLFDDRFNRANIFIVMNSDSLLHFYFMNWKLRAWFFHAIT